MKYFPNFGYLDARYLAYLLNYFISSLRLF